MSKYYIENSINHGYYNTINKSVIKEELYQVINQSERKIQKYMKKTKWKNTRYKRRH
jgi:hypothetical protein